MAQDIGGNIGKRVAALAFHVANRSNSISLAVVTKVDYEKLKVDVRLKNTKDTKIVDLYSCPILSQSYSGGGQINIPQINDLVVVLYSKYNIEAQIRKGSLAINNIDEINISEQNYGIVIGTIYPAPESDDPAPPVEEPTPDKYRTEGMIPHAILPDPEPRFNRPPVFHAEKIPHPGDEDQMIRFRRDRLEPHKWHQIWYHPYDHEIRLTKQEVYIKHKTGTQIILREPGDLEIYVMKTMNVHACSNITINSEQRAVMNSYVPHKPRPWRITDSSEDNDTSNYGGH